MGLVEKWNTLARKKIYINHTFEIGVGRLVYSAILFIISVIWGVLAGATALQIMPSVLLWARSFQQSEKAISIQNEKERLSKLEE